MFFNFKIPIVKASENVGEHLQDHLTTMLGPFFVNQAIVFDIVKFFTPAVVWEFLSKGTGKYERNSHYLFLISLIIVRFELEDLKQAATDFKFPKIIWKVYEDYLKPIIAGFLRVFSI